MSKIKNKSKKSFQHYDNEELTTIKSKALEPHSKNAVQQVFLRQSVTILAYKDKSKVNSTASTDVLKPKLLFGILSEDIPVFVSAVIGAALVVSFFLAILTYWKCCRMQLLKKKKYWLHTKDTENEKYKHGLPSVVQSNSVVFLGLKSSVYDCQKVEKPLESYSLPKLETVSEKEEIISEQGHSNLYAIMSATSTDALETENCVSQKLPSLPESSISQCSEPVEPTYVNFKQITQHLNSSNQKDHENVIHENHVTIPSHCDDSMQSSPAIFHRTYYSGTFDQRSLYSCTSYLGSEMDLKTCSLTWSSYNLRPSSTADCYYDIFQKASLCKKRKNRMRVDIAAAIALNRSQSTQLNKEKDTDSLVESEMEIVLDERTTL